MKRCAENHLPIMHAQEACPLCEAVRDLQASVECTDQWIALYQSVTSEIRRYANNTDRNVPRLHAHLPSQVPVKVPSRMAED